MTDAPADLSKLAIHTFTTKPLSLEEACAAYAEAGVPAITVWRQHVEPYGLVRAAAIVKGAGLAVPALCRGGFFPAPDATGRQAAIDDNRRALDEAAALAAGMVVLVCGAVPGQTLATSRTQIRDGIAAIMEHAKSLGVRVAI